ncbi:MAG: L-histidine N(alpha)-methyltransferase [Croceimicrobium sp.]
MNQYLQDVIHGLQSEDKYLLSRYFYNEEGDRLFQEIMELDEYYLTRAEKEIFQIHAADICAEFPSDAYRIAELGAGDGTKTRYLLEAALKAKSKFEYFPIDISPNVLNILKAKLEKALPSLKIKGLAQEYFEALSTLAQLSDIPLVVLFLGSNIGNFRRDNVDTFIAKLSDSLRPGDLFLLGVDKKKDPNRILAAYNDSRGITAAFNFNSLKRINADLGGNFDLQKFSYYNNYDPHSGESRSYLISKEEQEVFIKAAKQSFHFEAHEAIHTETSRKYGASDLQKLASRHGFKIKREFSDEQKLFRNQIWEKL